MSISASPTNRTDLTLQLLVLTHAAALLSWLLNPNSDSLHILPHHFGSSSPPQVALKEAEAGGGMIGPTCDICGLRLISFRLMVRGLRLLSSWHSSTPSRRVCARSNTCAVSAVTRWFSGSTLQPISHTAHCLQYSMMSNRAQSVDGRKKNKLGVPIWIRCAPWSLRSARSARLSKPRSLLCRTHGAAAAYESVCDFPLLLLPCFHRGGHNSHRDKQTFFLIVKISLFPCLLLR